MVRVAIIGVVVAAAFTLYALVDAAMSEPSRARGLSKPVWVVLVVVLPVIGAALWFTIGRGNGSAPARTASAPDDDPRFSGTRMNARDLDAHMRELEDRLRELDEEVFPGERPAEEAAGDERSAGPAGEASARPGTGEAGTGQPGAGDTGKAQPGEGDEQQPGSK